MSYFRFLLRGIKNDQKPKVAHKHSVPRKKNKRTQGSNSFISSTLRGVYRVLPERYKEWLELQQLLNHSFVRHRDTVTGCSDGGNTKSIGAPLRTGVCA